MGGEISKRDANFITVMTGVGDDADQFIFQLRLDPTTKRLKVTQSALDKATDSVIAELEGHDNFEDDKGEVVTAATKVQLPDVACKRVKIICSEWNADEANCPNGGVIVVGGSTVVAALATRQGAPIYPTQGEWFNVSNLNLLYIDAVDDGAKYHYVYEN